MVCSIASPPNKGKRMNVSATKKLVVPLAIAAMTVVVVLFRLPGSIEGCWSNMRIDCLCDSYNFIELADGKMRAERMTEEGYDVVEAELPVLISVVKEINEPRIASLKGKMSARKAEIPVWTAEFIGADTKQLGLDGSPTMVVEVFSPQARKGGKTTY